MPHSIEDAECLRETDDALLIDSPDTGEEWVPRSVIHKDSEVWTKGERGELLIKKWWARKKGWM